MSSRYREQLNEILKTITLTGPKVLSIGCQEDDRKVFGKIENLEEYLTLDIDPSFSPNIVWDMNKAIDDSGYLNVSEKFIEYFDTIIVLNLWEYIYDPITAHANIANLLRPGGLLITNYPFIYPVHKPVGTDFLRYTPEGAEKFLQLAGLRVINSKLLLGDDLLIDYYQTDRAKARENFNHKTIGLLVQARKG